MTNEGQSPNFTFPKWVNVLPLYILIGAALLLSFVVFVFWYWFSPKNLEVGYQPKQPIPYSHKLHVSELGLDCRYCHTNVERSGHANIPSTDTCLNCHKVVKTESPYIKKLQASYDSNTPIQWVKVHKLPDYVYFNHSRHVNAGVSCYTCHGRVDQMETVHQVQPLSMSWCLDCHRAPENHLRPKEFVTKLDWKADNQAELGKQIKEAYKIRPREDCSTCHR
ncbi:ammonia-forming cytochrome c nitrite reductase subunit c552 [bacterium]|nr:ammonia-forming cytochrome c nitrite reductase subunit c552 [bacterium]